MLGAARTRLAGTVRLKVSTAGACHFQDSAYVFPPGEGACRGDAHSDKKADDLAALQTFRIRSHEQRRDALISTKRTE
jgi:hypothetical protein